MFADCIDCRMETKTGGYIAGILRPIIQKIGPANVVALCTDGGSNYGKACKVLREEWPHIEHVPCATHVLDLLMEDVGKQAWAKRVVEGANEVINYVRNHHWTRNFLREPGELRGKVAKIFGPDKECTDLFKEFIGRYSSTITIDRKEAKEKSAVVVLQEGVTAFLKLRGSFGKPDAIMQRQKVKEGSLSMEDWWTWHGTDHPELAELACRVLTQPVSASSCERGWAVWESVHTARRNRLGPEKCRDLV
ncbi:hypothetical protein CLOM_g23882, partial [Closterium sp. NIES-68]